MHVFVYEWVSGGGLLGLPGRIPDSLLREGLAMAQAVATDLGGGTGRRVSLLRDLRVMQLVAPGCEILPVDSSSAHDEELERLLTVADAVVLIAPETDGVLLKLVRRAESLGARLASPGTALVEVAGDKQATAAGLHAGGVPTPIGVLLEPGEAPPRDFPYPAVLKPIDGAGSQDTYILATADDRPPDYAWPRRLEAYVPGQPASVGLLTGAGEPVPLPPCRQHISTDGRLSYLGGSTPLPEGLARRATGLALAAIAALPASAGYVGVDLVLGHDPLGIEDRVIEVNPRLTTSFAGLRFACLDGLSGAMLENALGVRRVPIFHKKEIEFDSAGVTCFRGGNAS